LSKIKTTHHKTAIKTSCLFFLLFPLLCTYSQNKHSSFKFIGQYIIENNLRYNQTVIGGLSGIDYYADSVFYLLSDDKGEHGPPRFYKARINYSKNEGIQKVKISDVTYLHPPNGSTFKASHAPVDTDKFLVSDAESIRYDKNTNHILWSSEGYNSKNMLTQPFIFVMDTAGTFINNISTAPVFRFDTMGKKGLQHNATFEALVLIPNSNNIIYCTEKCLLQDMGSVNDSLTPIRMTIADKKSGTTLVQFAYELENVFNNHSNGVTELLAISQDTFFVLERAYDKQKGNSVRLYRASVDDGVTDIKNNNSLKGEKYTVLKKELLLDFSKTGAKYIDNIEGMTWGYPISENKKTILFISDNNFNSSQITQLLLFEYLQK
jgi:hypothetical protein